MCGICGFVNKWDKKKKEKNLDLNTFLFISYQN